MKKSIIALSTVFLLSVGVASAQVTKTEKPVTATEQVQQEKQVEIAADKLPASIQSTLKTEKFSDWKVGKAYEIKTDANQKMYEVVLTNGEKKATYKFDENGKVVG